jgi:hypothetical protein
VDLVDDLAAFLAEHRRCGGMEGGVEGRWVRLRCGCGAVMIRRADED